MKVTRYTYSGFLFSEGVVQPEAILKDLHHYIWNSFIITFGIADIYEYQCIVYMQYIKSQVTNNKLKRLINNFYFDRRSLTLRPRQILSRCFLLILVASKVNF